MCFQILTFLLFYFFFFLFTISGGGGSTTTGGKESDLWAGKQYLHRTGGAFVRVLKDGLLWIPNRMTNTTNTRAVWKNIQQLFVVFRSFTQTINECYSILLQLIEEVPIAGGGQGVVRESPL